MIAHCGADESLAEAKNHFQTAEDVGNVTASADPLSRQRQNLALELKKSQDAPCSSGPIIT